MTRKHIPCLTLIAFMSKTTGFRQTFLPITSRRISFHSKTEPTYLSRYPCFIPRSDIFQRYQSNLASHGTSGLAPVSNNDTFTNHHHQQQQQSQQPQVGLSWKDNPTIANTALAHILWSSVLRPNIDSAIDATCGNGHDSVAIGRMLFPSSSISCNGHIAEHHQDDNSKSQLVCVDIQEKACQTTLKALQKEFGTEMCNNDKNRTSRIQVLHTSHAPLPHPIIINNNHNNTDNLSVALVVYNLGWLPNSEKQIMTQMETTLQSIVDSMLLVRIGGMISVMTYPRSNAQEDLAVRTFLECVALASNNHDKKEDSWQEYLQQQQQQQQQQPVAQSIQQCILANMERLIQSQGQPGRSWRISEHRKLGMDQSPILLTAVRIK